MHVAQREDMFEFWGEGDIDWNFGGGQESTLSLPSYHRFVNSAYFFSCFLVYWHFSLCSWCSVLLKRYSTLIMLFLKCGENWRSNTIYWTHLNYSLSDDYWSANKSGYESFLNTNSSGHRVQFSTYFPISEDPLRVSCLLPLQVCLQSCLYHSSPSPSPHLTPAFSSYLL